MKPPHAYIGELKPVEKTHFDNAKLTFFELLNILKQKQMIRLGPPHNQIKRLIFLWEQSNLFSKVHNATVNVFMTKNLESFIDKNIEYGFTEDIIANAMFLQIIGTFIFDLETIIKTSLIFFLNEKKGIRKKTTLTPLIIKIKKIAPEIGSKFEGLLDIELRNSIAHGAIWYDPELRKVCLAENSYLDEIIKIGFDDFWIRVKKQNIYALAFIEVLWRKFEEGFFKLPLDNER